MVKSPWCWVYVLSFYYLWSTVTDLFNYTFQARQINGLENEGRGVTRSVKKKKKKKTIRARLCKPFKQRLFLAKANFDTQSMFKQQQRASP